MPTLVCDNYRVEHMEKHNRHIDELITKYLDKSLTREECAELRRYLAEDKKHLAYFAEIRDLWLYNTALWQPIISTRSALEKLKKRIRKYTSLVKIRRTVYYASQIAAVIAITFIFHTVKESNAYSATTHTVLTSTHKSEVTLPDGTIVWLNNNTKLIYPEAFSSTERSVYLEGEAYFKVTKNKARPFVVKSQGQEIKVLGTSFNVRNRPNEQITYSKSNQSIRKDTVVAHEYIAWATEKMTFDNDRFTDVISYLEDKYQLQIICPEEIADTLYLTLVVRNETKEEIFKEIARISHLQYSIHNDTVYFDFPENTDCQTLQRSL